MKRNELISFGVTLILLAIILGLLSGFDKIDFGQGLQILITLVLVMITVIYVKRTAEIAQATKEQAEANVKMAEEMREQRLDMAQPYLLIKLTNEHEKLPLPGDIEVTILNQGNGPAINLNASLWHPKTIHAYDSKGYLASGEEWQVNLSTLDVGVPYEGEKEVRPWLPELKTIINNPNFGAVVVLYNDIHKRDYLSYLSLEQIDEDIPYVSDGEQNMMKWKVK